MKKIVYFIASLAMFSLLTISCKDSVLEDASNLKRAELESEIDNLEIMSKTKLFRRSVEVIDKSGTNSITLLVASSSEKQLNDFISTNQFGLDIFSNVSDFLNTFKLSENKKDNTGSLNQTERSTGNGIHIEIQKKSFVNNASFFALHVKTNAISSKNAKVNYNNETNYYTSDGANNGTMSVARSPYIANGGTSVNQYIDFSFAVRTRFSDYSTQSAFFNVTAPNYEPYYYSYRGRIRVNYDSSQDYFVNF